MSSGAEDASKQFSEQDYPHIETGDQNAVKNVLDDTIIEYFRDAKIRINYSWDNFKIFIMLGSCAIAALSHFYKNPAISEHVLVYSCVGGFFFLQAILACYSYFIEQDILLRVNVKEIEIYVKTDFPQTEDNFLLTFESSITKKSTQKFYVGKYFDEEGYFHKQKFLQAVETAFMDFQKAS